MLGTCVQSGSYNVSYNLKPRPYLADGSLQQPSRFLGKVSQNNRRPSALNAGE